MTGWDGVINIGPVLAADLDRAGVQDLETLRRLGSVEAGKALEAAGAHDCSHAVLALEGALHGVRWTDLPATVRHTISQQWKERR